MSIFDFIGGAARGFGEEGRYLDKQAAEARQEALRLRAQIASEAQAAQEATTRQQQLEHQAKMEQLTKEYQHEEKLMRIQEAQAERESERAARETQLKIAALTRKTQLDIASMEQKFKLEHPELATGRRGLTQKELDKMKPRDRARYEILTQANPNLAEDPETYVQRIRAQADLVDEFLPEDLGGTGGVKVPNVPISKAFIDKELKGVSTREDAIDILKKSPARALLGTQPEELDQVMGFIEGLPKKRIGIGPGLYLDDTLGVQDQKQVRTRVRETVGRNY